MIKTHRQNVFSPEKIRKWLLTSDSPPIPSLEREGCLSVMLFINFRELLNHGSYNDSINKGAAVDS